MHKNIGFYIVAEGHDTNKFYSNEHEAIKALKDSAARFGSIYMVVYAINITADGKIHRRMNTTLDGEDQISLNSIESNNSDKNERGLSTLNETLLIQNTQLLNELWTLKSMVSNLESLILAVRSLFNIYKSQYGGKGKFAETIPGRYEFNRILDVLGSDPNKHLKEGLHDRK